jgi:GNAT superfamily N-acetyltransferase
MEPGVGEVKRIFVRPEFQRRGIGRQILAALERRALDLGHSLLRLETAAGSARSDIAVRVRRLLPDLAVRRARRKRVQPVFREAIDTDVLLNEGRSPERGKDPSGWWLDYV